MIYPKNQIEFEKMFATEEDCIKYIIALRWPEASGKYLLKWIRMNLQQGGLVITDGWKGYNRLKQNGYEHRYRQSNC